jgi:predicted ribosome quality control (RQC) complex YloA/Tae2 family protein
MPISKVIHFLQCAISVEYIIGKNSQENFDIINEAKNNHLWFHIEGNPSGHVIAKIDEKYNKKTMRYIVKQGAVLCKQFSKYASSKNVNIIYASVCDVEKTEILGTVHVNNQKMVCI